MPAYNGNNVYMEIDNVDVSPYFATVSLQLNVGDEDVTGGSGVEWEEHADKLQRVNLDFTLIYDVSNLPTYIAVLGQTPVGGKHAVKLGPESNAAGKPKHDQPFKFNSVNGPALNHDKTKVVFEVSAVSTGAPTTNFFAGGTW